MAESFNARKVSVQQWEEAELSAVAVWLHSSSLMGDGGEESSEATLPKFKVGCGQLKSNVGHINPLLS